MCSANFLAEKYDDAVVVSNKACLTSNIDTEEDISTKKRVAGKPIRYLDSDTDLYGDGKIHFSICICKILINV